MSRIGNVFTLIILIRIGSTHLCIAQRGSHQVPVILQFIAGIVDTRPARVVEGDTHGGVDKGLRFIFRLQQYGVFVDVHMLFFGRYVGHLYGVAIEEDVGVVVGIEAEQLVQVGVVPQEAVVAVVGGHGHTLWEGQHRQVGVHA